MEDSEILRLFRQRHETALEETAQKYGKRLLAMSRDITGSSTDAEECLNDTYLRAWQSIPPETPGNLFAYLTSIIRRLSLDVLRSRHADKRSALVVELTRELGECLVDRAEETERIDGPAIREALRHFLESQSLETREIFVRRYFYMESLSAIAAEVGRSESAVTSVLSRARVQLKKQLEKEGVYL